MSAKRKHFISRSRPSLVVVEDHPAPAVPSSWIITFPANSVGVRSHDLSEYAGKGFDELLRACVGVISEMVVTKSVRVASAIAYARSGVASLFEFLVENREGHHLAVSEVDRELIEDFLAWLRLKGKGANAGRPAYNHMKAVVMVLVRRGMVTAGRDIFPRNPYPQSNRKAQGEKRLSNTEKARLALALKQDLVEIGKGRFEGTDVEAKSVLVLSLALRAGLNTHPALDMEVDCMQPHPLVKGQYLLEFVKHRSKSVRKRPTRQPKVDQERALAAGDVAAIVQFTIKVTGPLRSKAPKSIAKKLWLFESEAQTNAGTISVLNKSNLSDGIRRIRNRHGLEGDDGKPMRLNLSRLRKTFSNSLWRLSGGDVRVVAAALGNVPRVVDDHYLEVTEEMERNHAFVGRSLVEKWRGDDPTGSQVDDDAPRENTPVGSCSDPFNGDKAPKDGNACIDFLSCFSCKSYVLVEDPRDLHRLFSFYYFLDGERERIGISAWAERYGWILRLIDEVTSLRFNSDTVTCAKKRGREEPIKFWRTMPSSGVIPNVE